MEFSKIQGLSRTAGLLFSLATIPEGNKEKNELAFSWNFSVKKEFIR